MESIIPLDNCTQAVFDASHDAMAIVTADSGKFIAINDAHSRVFGYSLDALNKLGLSRFFKFDNEPAHIGTLQELLQAKPYEVFLWHACNHLGGTVEVELSCNAIELASKQYLLLVSKPISHSDSATKFSGMISIEQAFHDSEAKWRSISENSVDHIMLIDPQGTILYINHTVPGLTIDQVIGQSAYNFVKPEQIHFLKQNYEYVVRTGKPSQFEIAYETEYGEIIYLDNRVGPVLREGKVIALAVTSHDVTGWRETLKALEKSREHLSHALKAGKTGTWEWNLESNEVTWSDGVEAMFGMTPGSFKGSYDSYTKLIHPDDLPKVEERIQQTIEHNVPYYVEHRCLFPDGSLHWLSGQGKVYRNDDGTPIRMIGTVTDITQRRESERALRQSEFLLSKSQEITHIGSYHWDLKTNKFTWSDEMHNIFGIPKHEFDGDGAKVLQKVIHPDDQEKLVKAQQIVIHEKKSSPMEYRVVRPDGNIRYVWADGYLQFDDQNDVMSVIGTVQDITERKQAEAALLESQQKLSLHVKQTPLGVISFDTDLNITEWNPAAEKIFGYNRNEVIGRNAIGLIAPDNVKEQFGSVWQSLLTAKGSSKNTNENVTKDGNTIVCEWYNTPLVDDQGQVIGVSSLVHDVTERIEAQNELEKHRKHLEDLVAERTEEIREQALILDQIHDSVVATDMDGYITSWNRGAERMFDVNAQDAIGKHISFIYPEDQHEFLNKEVIEPLLEKHEHESEVIMHRKSGEKFNALLSLSMKQDENGDATGMIGYSIDITARKQAENEVNRHKAELEIANRELEAFSYSVSHDLRAPLRSIDGFSALIYDDYYESLDEQGKESLQRIRQNSQRMAALIDDLLKLSRVTRHVFHREPTNLSLLAEDVIQKYKYEQPDRKISISIDDDMRDDADAGLMRIALDNLISNAWKYTSNKQDASILFHKVKFNGTLTYCIEDNGIGFDMRYVDKLFGAFQRLHGPEEFSGNGIGLATVSRIINRHGGQIWAEGKVNEGAKFYFTLKNLR